MEKSDDNLKLAVSVILITVLLLSFSDALIKMLSAQLVLWQIFVLRSLVAIPLLLLIRRFRFKALSFLPADPGWTALRSLMLTFMWVSYYMSLPHLDLSIAAAAYYTLPIFITLFSAYFLGDTIGVKGWMATGIGFVGTLLILRPLASDFNAYLMLPLLSAVLYALAMILTRSKCRDEHPLVLSMALNIAFVGVGLTFTLAGALINDNASTFLLAEWSMIGLREIVAICVLGLTILVASIGTAVAYQRGPSGVVSTFDFAYVAFAGVWGYVFFSEFPDNVSIVGILLIVLAGVVAVRK